MMQFPKLSHFMSKPINLCIDTNSRNLELTVCQKFMHQLRNVVNFDMQAAATEKKKPDSMY